jgi:hypothetical protein
MMCDGGSTVAKLGRLAVWPGHYRYINDNQYIVTFSVKSLSPPPNIQRGDDGYHRH